MEVNPAIHWRKLEMLPPALSPSSSKMYCPVVRPVKTWLYFLGNRGQWLVQAAEQRQHLIAENVIRSQFNYQHLSWWGVHLWTWHGLWLSILQRVLFWPVIFSSSPRELISECSVWIGTFVVTNEKTICYNFKINHSINRVVTVVVVMIFFFFSCSAQQYDLKAAFLFLFFKC